MSRAERPPVRADLKAMEGYHSPQLDVEVRLNTNESALEPPPGFTQALAAEFDDIAWNRYPDRAAGALREALAAAHSDSTANPDITADQIFVANGSNEILQTLCLTFGGVGSTVVTFEPTYAMYAQIARATQCGLLEIERGADYQVEAASISDLVATQPATQSDTRPASPQPNLLFLCSPNNPTGTPESLDLIKHALETTSAVVVVDEAYGQFSSFSALELLGDPAAKERLVVVRTFSKTWAMAGLRLGYCIAPEWMLAEFDKVVLPYHVDSFKQLAGRLALEFGAEMDQRVASVVAERVRVSAELAEMGFDVSPSQANFVLFNTAPTGRGGDEIWQALVDQSVLVRNCSSWPRLANCLRATIGTSKENDRFLAAAAASL